MKTIFSLGTMYNRSPWLASAAEGQDLMDQDRRDAILARLTPAMAKVKEMQALVDWSHDHDPYLKNFFGDDQGAFWMAWQGSEALRPTMDGLYKRLNESDPEFWTALSNDEDDVLNAGWPENVGNLYTIYQQHYAALPPGQKPGTSAPPVSAAPVPISTPAPQPVVTTTEVLTGVGILAALGVFVYAVT